MLECKKSYTIEELENTPKSKYPTLLDWFEYWHSQDNTFIEKLQIAFLEDENTFFEYFQNRYIYSTYRKSSSEIPKLQHLNEILQEDLNREAPFFYEVGKVIMQHITKECKIHPMPIRSRYDDIYLTNTIKINDISITNSESLCYHFHLKPSKNIKSIGFNLNAIISIHYWIISKLNLDLFEYSRNLISFNYITWNNKLTQEYNEAEALLYCTIKKNYGFIPPLNTKSLLWNYYLKVTKLIYSSWIKDKTNHFTGELSEGVNPDAKSDIVTLARIFYTCHSEIIKQWLLKESKETFEIPYQTEKDFLRNPGHILFTSRCEIAELQKNETRTLTEIVNSTSIFESIYNHLNPASPKTKYKPREKPKLNLDKTVLEKARDDFEYTRQRLTIDYEEENQNQPAQPRDKQPDTPLDTGWSGFKSRLSPTQLAFLKESINSTGYTPAQKKIAAENGRMLEEFADEINEIAQETMGDIILEDGIIVETYKENIEELFQ